MDGGFICTLRRLGKVGCTEGSPPPLVGTCVIPQGDNARWNVQRDPPLAGTRVIPQGDYDAYRLEV